MIDRFGFSYVDFQCRLSFRLDGERDLFVRERMFLEFRRTMDQVNADIVHADEDARATTTIFVFTYDELATSVTRSIEHYR